MRGYFIFASKDSRDYRIGIEKCPTYPVAQRVIEKTTVSGRSGDLVFDTGAYANVTQEYEIYFNAKQMGLSPTAGCLAQWLQSGRGYQRLEDNYRPDSYRMALFTGPLDINNWMNLYGRATLQFDCQPQRWLKLGEQAISITSGQTIYNPGMPSEPLIEVVGNGTLNIGKYTITVKDITGTGPVSIDSEAKDAWQGMNNANGNVQLENHQYPIIQSGEVEITYTGFTSVSITPRWWTL